MTPLRTYEYHSIDRVIASSDGQRSPRHITLNLDLITADADAQKFILPDEFIASIPGSTLGRILPRAKTAAVSAASATTLTLNRAKNFVPGDVLSVLAPMAKLNIASASGGWADADTVTLTLANYVLVVTVVAGDIGAGLAATNLNLANKIAAAIRADAYLSKIVDALASAGATTTADIFIWSKDFLTPYSIGVADTGANGTASIGGSLTALRAGQAIGTIAALGVNTTTNVVTISAASTNLPSGMPIGVAGPVPIGLAGQIYDLLKDSDTVTGYIAATVHGQAFHYWDGDIDRLLPGLKFTSKLP